MITVGAVVLLLCFSGSAVHATESFPLSWPARLKIPQGEIVEIKVYGEGLSSVEGRWAERNLPFYPVAPGSFAAIIGVDLQAKPGLSKITIAATNDAGRQRRSAGERSVLKSSQNLLKNRDANGSDDCATEG